MQNRLSFELGIGQPTNPSIDPKKLDLSLLPYFHISLLSLSLFPPSPFYLLPSLLSQFLASPSSFKAMASFPTAVTKIYPPPPPFNFTTTSSIGYRNKALFDPLETTTSPCFGPTHELSLNESKLNLSDRQSTTIHHRCRPWWDAQIRHALLQIGNDH